jgi:hypothetical protein
VLVRRSVLGGFRHFGQPRWEATVYAFSTRSASSESRKNPAP